MIIIKKYKRNINSKHQTRHKRKISGRGAFVDAFWTLGSFVKLYKAIGGK